MRRAPRSASSSSSFTRMNAEWVVRLIAHAGHGSQDVDTTRYASFRDERAGGMAAAKDRVDPTPRVETCSAELARRAAAIAHGDRRTRQATGPATELMSRIDAAEQ